MGYAELIERLQALPQAKQAEVFDFVEFLSSRSAIANSQPLARGELTEAEFSAMAMQQALRGMEDDPIAYTRDDLRERWQ